jgi:hypothetical protein
MEKPCATEGNGNTIMVEKVELSWLVDGRGVNSVHFARPSNKSQQNK